VHACQIGATRLCTKAVRHPGRHAGACLGLSV
jgi:hypothetical protein